MLGAAESAAQQRTRSDARALARLRGGWDARPSRFVTSLAAGVSAAAITNDLAPSRMSGATLRNVASGSRAEAIRRVKP